jgi:small-conductance mechanosensitive channel
MNNCPETSIIFVQCDADGNGIINLLQTVVTIVSAGVIVLAIIGITFASIKWATAGGNSSRTAEAKKMILNIVIGLAAYAVLAAFLWYIGIDPNA